jgi:kynurenine formamidase
MKIKTFVVGYALALAIFLFAQRRTPSEQDPRFVVVDLTHSTTLVAPTQEAVAPSPAHDRDTKVAGNDAVFTREILSAERYGTHLDAPAHLQHGLWTVDQIPAERLVAPLVVLNVRSKAKYDPNYQISVNDVADWEQVHGQIPQGAVVLANTGWESRWTSAKDYRNSDAQQIMHFPGFSAETARFLVEGRIVIGLGIDTLSLDYGASKDFPVHKYASSHSLYQLENVANLEQAPESGGTVVVAPSKLAGQSDAPVRILALLK